MSFKEAILKMLIGRGMFEEQANETLKRTMEMQSDMKGRWDDSTNDYPNMLLGVVLLSAKSCGLKLIDEKYPEAWFRSLFAKKQ